MRRLPSKMKLKLASPVRGVAEATGAIFGMQRRGPYWFTYSKSNWQSWQHVLTFYFRPCCLGNHYMSTESQFDFRERESGGWERQERKNALCQHSLFFTHSDQKKNCISRSLVVAETLLGVHYCAIRGKKESSLNVSGPSENITVVFIREQDKGATWEVGAYGASSLDVNWPNTCRRRRGRRKGKRRM